MILYFSATGNNKYIAEKIAEETNDTAISIENYGEKEIILKENENLGIITPTYFWELPINVKDFLKRVPIHIGKDNYVYGVVTYGTTPGASGSLIKKLLSRQNINLQGLYSIITPDTWTVMFDLSNPKKVKQTLCKTEEQLEKVIQNIKLKKKGDYRNRKTPLYVTYVSDFMYEKARKTSNFQVNESCIRCGLCAKNCPANAIQMEDGKPVWKKDQCIACLRCLHRCPKFAIQYGKKTQKHGQYTKNKYPKETLQ